MRPWGLYFLITRMSTCVNIKSPAWCSSIATRFIPSSILLSYLALSYLWWKPGSRSTSLSLSITQPKSGIREWTPLHFLSHFHMISCALSGETLSKSDTPSDQQIHRAWSGKGVLQTLKGNLGRNGTLTASSGLTISLDYGCWVLNFTKDYHICTAEMWTFWTLYIGPVLLWKWLKIWSITSFLIFLWSYWPHAWNLR